MAVSRPVFRSLVVGLAVESIAWIAWIEPAQAADTLPTCIRYVDPVAGNDGAVGSLTYPWKTINRALYGSPTMASPGTVVLLPGVYSATASGENMPIRMRDGISLQGTNALNTILDGEGSDVIHFTSFIPSEDYDDTLIDGVTITNGDRGILFRSESNPVRPTIANCFIVKNRIGVLVRTICDLDEPIDGYHDYTFALVNDTIADNEIGIFDEGIPALGCDDDVNGESSPCIVNCLVYPNSCSDLQGVDDDDLRNTVFCTFDVAQFNCPANYPPSSTSVIRPDRPIPNSLLNVCGLSRTDIYLIPSRWDYRLRPHSMFVDEGTMDVETPNGTIGRTTFPCDLDVFDVDCEGYFNKRIAGSAPDIGADEQGQLIIAGYAAKTTDFNATHSTAFMFMTPEPALSGSLSAELYVGSGALGYTWFHPFATPGARPKGTTAPASTPIGFSVVNPSLLLPGYPLTIAMPPVGTALSFSQTSPTPVRRNVQVLPKNGSGGQTTLSNLQSYVIQP